METETTVTIPWFTIYGLTDGVSLLDISMTGTQHRHFGGNFLVIQIFWVVYSLAAILCLYFAFQIHIWLEGGRARKLERQPVEQGRAIFSLTHIEEVSSQPFANIPRCIALGVTEGLFILAEKKQGALEEIEGVRLNIVSHAVRSSYILHQGHIILVVPVISLLFEVHHNFLPFPLPRLRLRLP